MMRVWLILYDGRFSQLDAEALEVLTVIFTFRTSKITHSTTILVFSNSITSENEIAKKRNTIQQNLELEES